MCEVSLYEAKTNLSKYVSMLAEGKEKDVLILRNGKPIARLVPVEEEAKQVRLGAGLLFGEYRPFDVKDPDYGISKLFGYEE